MGSKHLIVAALICAGILALGAGCSSSEDSPKVISREKAVNELETKFDAAEDRVKKHITAAAAALKEKKYDAAFFALESVKADRSLTADQMEAIHNANQVLQNALAAAIAAGDTNALRAVQLIRGGQ